MNITIMMFTLEDLSNLQTIVKMTASTAASEKATVMQTVTGLQKSRFLTVVMPDMNSVFVPLFYRAAKTDISQMSEW